MTVAVTLRWQWCWIIHFKHVVLLLCHLMVMLFASSAPLIEHNCLNLNVEKETNKLKNTDA